MATTKDNIRLIEIEKNEPRVIKLGGKTYKLKPMTNAVSEMADRYIASRSVELKEAESGKELIVNMSKNRTVIPKYISLLMLHSWLKVKLFHWIHWRYLHAHYPLSTMFELYKEFMNLNDVGDFFQFTASLQENNRLIKRMSETNTQIIRQEHKSDQETPSSPNSTEQ